MTSYPTDPGRRTLLKSAGALAITGTLPARLAFASAKESAYDVIVVGGGTAGIPLFLTLAESGARVLLIEKSPVLGGTLDRSYASTSAAGSTLQRAAGISDSPEAHYDDIMRGTRGVADPILVRLWTRHAAKAVDWLSASGVKFNFLRDSLGGRSQMVDGYGKAVIAALEPRINAVKGKSATTIVYGSRVVELIQDHAQRVVGVVVEDENGVLHDFRGANVVLASGGAGGNPSLYQELHQVPLYNNIAYPFNQGDGLILGRSVGGIVRGSDAYIPIMGIVMSDDMIPSTALLGSFQETSLSGRGGDPWAIWVNANGQRFVREDSTESQEAERALGRQPAHRVWAVHDHDAFIKAPSPMQGWDRERYIAGFGTQPFFFKAQTLDQLALKAGVDANGLANSVRQYNNALTTGSIDPLGRSHRPAPIARPPFYAVRFQGYHLLTFSGLTVNEHLNVVRADDTPVENLFAIGEILGATALGCSAHSTGAMVTPAVTFGLLLGERLAQERMRLGHG